MSIGYACKIIGIPSGSLKGCVLKSATESHLHNLIQENLQTLEQMLLYNIKNGIKLFRISSDLIPFATHPVNQIDWQSCYRDSFLHLGNLIRENGLRVSMHPGQYTLLNSPTSEVVTRAIDDLAYHTQILDSMQLDHTHKLILHIGGLYGDKQEAINRFFAVFPTLPLFIRNRLVLENDEKCYHIEDVLPIAQKVGVPVVFDLLHHEILSPPTYKPWQEWLTECHNTWESFDGAQKIHYSQQKKDAPKGAHSDTINVNDFMKICKDLPENVDVMLEVKDKNLSAIKCMLATDIKAKISKLEGEWAKYKYFCLSKSQKHYLSIRTLLKDKHASPLDFYRLVDECLALPYSKENTRNTFTHLWGYFKDQATESEKNSFLKNLMKFDQDALPHTTLKKQLFRLSEKYHDIYLLQSYYFYL